MKEKIKIFFEFLKRAWAASSRGKIGIVLMLLSIFFFARLFCGTRSVQSFVINAWRLNHERAELAVAQKQLAEIQHHIYLLQHPNASSDYIEELGLQVLNLGNPEFKELKY
jgi:cell division protein FtsB